MTAWVNEQSSPDYPLGRDLSAKRICELATTGDDLAKRAVDREAYYLGLGLANLVTMFCPDSIVLGGSIMKSAPLFLSRIKEVIRQSCALVPFDKTELTLASLGEDANLIGAASVWYHRFRNNGV
jgi:glucokinase